MHFNAVFASFSHKEPFDLVHLCMHEFDDKLTFIMCYYFFSDSTIFNFTLREVKFLVKDLVIFVCGQNWYFMSSCCVVSFRRNHLYKQESGLCCSEMFT